MQDFDKIIGHKSIIEHLQNAILSRKVSHAYIFHGEKGMGKKLLASKLAKTLQCEEKGANPCNQCKSCLQADTSNHPDIIWVTHEKASIGVDDIRIQVNADIHVKPYSSAYKIYIIDSAEKLTEQAQNALLKTIEEPPEYGIIILLIDNINAILPTILSRCILLNLRPVEKKAIMELLMYRYQIPDYKAEVAANFSGGNVGKAIKYASSEDFDYRKEEILQILKDIDTMELSELIAKVKVINENKEYIDDIIDFMVLWYRDILMLKATKDPNLLLYKEEYQFIKSIAQIKSFESINNIIDAIEKTKQRLKANVNFDITIENMLLTIKENRNG
ncbi:MAG: DNA polymerase III subunit delta' [Clostridiales bacterium]|nr:DNA polymerase III subunit delta' [Clostridiales bacterium]